MNPVIIKPNTTDKKIGIQLMIFILPDARKEPQQPINACRRLMKTGS